MVIKSRVDCFLKNMSLLSFYFSPRNIHIICVFTVSKLVKSLNSSPTSSFELLKAEFKMLINVGIIRCSILAYVCALLIRVLRMSVMIEFTIGSVLVLKRNSVDGNR